jgi:hypothetical protein
MLEDGVVVGRIFNVQAAPQGSPLDVGERPQQRHRTRSIRLSADTRRCDGGIR